MATLGSLAQPLTPMDPYAQPRKPKQPSANPWGTYAQTNSAMLGGGLPQMPGVGGLTPPAKPAAMPGMPSTRSLGQLGTFPGQSGTGGINPGGMYTGGMPGMDQPRTPGLPPMSGGMDQPMTPGPPPTSGGDVLYAGGGGGWNERTGRMDPPRTPGPPPTSPDQPITPGPPPQQGGLDPRRGGGMPSEPGSLDDPANPYYGTGGYRPPRGGGMSDAPRMGGGPMHEQQPLMTTGRIDPRRGGDPTRSDVGDLDDPSS